jgi:hypothetical protein
LVIGGTDRDVERKTRPEMSDTFEDNKKRRLETDERMRKQQEDFLHRQTTRREVARDRDAAKRDKEIVRPGRKYASTSLHRQAQESRDENPGKRNYKAAGVLLVGILGITVIAALMS